MSRIQSSEKVGVSAISCFEVAWLERHNRIALPCPRQEWLEKALAGSGIYLLPISPIVASIAVDLPEHHHPQDRIIIATALAYEGTLISADGKFPLYSAEMGRDAPPTQLKREGNVKRKACPLALCPVRNVLYWLKLKHRKNVRDGVTNPVQIGTATWFYALDLDDKFTDN